jgi:hypothetical protein
MEAPLGRVEISVGHAREVAWIALDLESVVEITC